MCSCKHSCARITDTAGDVFCRRNQAGRHNPVVPFL